MQFGIYVPAFRGNIAASAFRVAFTEDGISSETMQLTKPHGVKFSKAAIDTFTAVVLNRH